jgi:hypothetical protein
VGEFFKFDDQTGKTFYRGLTLFRFSNGEYGIAWETMNPLIESIWHGRYSSFDEMLTAANQIADKNGALVGAKHKRPVFRPR